MLRYDLHSSFRRVYWVGAWPPPLPDAPVIAYANHHHYYDGHLGWLLFREHLGRPTTLWMAEWDRFPFFGAVGAQPFPPDDPAERARTLHRTRTRFKKTPETVLIYYPEGELRQPDEGIGPFNSNGIERLSGIYERAVWWPFAIHVTWNGNARPIALLTGGSAHDADGDEHDRLLTHWRRLQDPPYDNRTLLLEGSESASERWSFSLTRAFFSRYL